MTATLRPSHQGHHELYGVFTDDEALQLAHPRDGYRLSRYPTFRPASSVVPTTPVVLQAPLHDSSNAPSDPSRPRRGRALAPEDAVPDTLNVPAVDASGSRSAQQSWYDPDAEVKPKKASTKLRRPPSRPPPPPPEIIASPPPAPASDSGLVMSEGSFARAMGPRRSAMKHGAAPAPLPDSALLSPSSAAQRRQQLRNGGSPSVISAPPSIVGSSIGGNTSYWMSPATTTGRLSSAGTSARGSSVGTASVAFTSSSYYSSSHPNSTVARNIPEDDGEPIEVEPRRTLFVVNADPIDTESEASPIHTKAPAFPTPPTTKGAPPRRKYKLSDPGRPVPPVPPIPAQFQAPVPPSADRARSDPAVPVSKSGSDRERATLKKHATDSRAAAHLTAPAAGKRSASRSKPSSGVNSRYSDTSSSDSESPLTPPAEGLPPKTSEGVLPKEYIYPLQLTLEDLFRGGKFKYRISTRLLSGESRMQEVEVDVKPGWKAGTRIIFPSAGNERRPGEYQDMIFVVEQVHHDRFARLEGGRLVLNQDISLVDALKEGPREKMKVIGLDGQVIEFVPPSGYIKPGMEVLIKGHGMYIRSKGAVVGRGDLVIRWNVCVPNNVTPDQMHKMRAIFRK